MFKRLLFLLLTILPCGVIQSQEYSAFHEGLINHISPKGWLQEFLLRQKNGLTGHPEAMAYRPVHETECCVGNVNRMMPNFASRLWMRGKDGAIVAALYSPNDITFDVDGQSVSISEQTAYPFSDVVRFVISSESAVTFPLSLRIPGWCQQACLKVNGTPVDMPLTPSTFVTLNRTFHDGDVIELQLPMQVQVRQAANQQGWYVERGPLLFTYAIPQNKVEDTHVYANMNGKHSDNAAPVTISLPVRQIHWSVQNGRNPFLPDAGNVMATDKTSTITLVPYGCTELRLTVFPEVHQLSSIHRGASTFSKVVRS